MPARCNWPIKSPAMLGWLLVVALFSGCQSTPTDHASTGRSQEESFQLHHIAPEKAREVLSDLDIPCGIPDSEPNTLVARGPASYLEIVAAILNVIDSNEPFIAESLCPASMVRALPSNGQIAQAVGGVTVGTFAHPPEAGATGRVIIDVLGDSVVAIAPARLWPDIRTVVTLGPEARRTEPTPTEVDGIKAVEPDQIISASNGQTDAEPHAADTHQPILDQPIAQMSEFGERVSNGTDSPVESARMPDENKPSAEQPQTHESKPAEQTVIPSPTGLGSPSVSRGVLRPSTKLDAKPAPAAVQRTEISFPNGDDVLELSLPEKIELMQLLDLAGKYLHLDCIYEAEKIGNQMITLKLHSKLRSEMRVKDLYCLLETVLKFKGLVMTRREGNLVTIVPAAEALEVDPRAGRSQQRPPPGGRYGRHARLRSPVCRRRQRHQSAAEHEAQRGGLSHRRDADSLCDLLRPSHGPHRAIGRYGG